MEGTCQMEPIQVRHITQYVKLSTVQQLTPILSSCFAVEHWCVQLFSEIQMIQ
jgi:hypothetical protein